VSDELRARLARRYVDSMLELDGECDFAAEVAVQYDQYDAMADFSRYFRDRIADLRAHPGDDLGSAIATATIDGEYLADRDAESYFTLIASAGQYTTPAVIAGGLHALLQYPEQFELLRAYP
jgi:cytochrome P450